jgi:hypothetical protein
VYLSSKYDEVYPQISQLELLKETHAKDVRSALGNDPLAGTDDMDPVYLETVTYHNRQFQQYAIDNRIYFAPADEVSTIAECREW